MGFIPSVTIESVSAVNSRHFLITRVNSAVLVTMWSLGDTTMFAFGSLALIFQLT